MCSEGALRGNNDSIRRFIKIYPWFTGLTGDLLFYIAIDTLFLTIVKSFSAAQIVSLLSLSQLVCIIIQFPILFIIKKIGNTASVRMSAFLLLMSAVFITVGNNYYLVLLGRIFHDAAAIFRSSSVVALENNLELLDDRSDFVRVRASGNTVYSIITMLISFVVSYMFNYNNYLPMICCIATCTIGFILSLFMRDCSDYNKISRGKSPKHKAKVHYGKLIIITVVVYSIFYPIVNNGQREGKLFIQQHLLLDFDIEETALIIGVVVCASRIVRVLSNIIFAKIYRKYQSKMGVALPCLLCFSMGCLLFGSFVPQIVIKILLMALGYAIILFVRDPFKLYIQDEVLGSTAKEQHQTLLTILEFGVKIVDAGTGLGFSAILVGYPMVVVMAIIFAVSLIEIALSVWLYRTIAIGKS